MAKKRHTVGQELKKHDFRVAIFGSARTTANDKVYRHVFKLAKEIGKHGFDMVTGGGPGLMEAANAGHAAGDIKHKADNIGLTIQLPKENKDNKHLEIKKHFNKFSGRLDNFVALSNAMVVMSGGIGTCLELFYCWQLVQVKHIHPIPIIVVGEQWEKLIRWVKRYLLKDKLINPQDMHYVHIAKNNKQAMEIILKSYKKFKEDGKNHSNIEYLKES